MPEQLSRLLSPKTIAVFGGRDAEAVIRQSQKLGFRGEIWPVNPKRNTMAGIPCYRSLNALPSPPDACFIAVNAETTIDLVAELAATGAGGAVLYAAGFDEAGEASKGRQARLVAAAGAMPILGPNCYGIVNAATQSALWPDEHGLIPANKGVALITQSGNIAINLSMQQRGLTVSHLVALGNQAVVTVDQIIDAMIDDPAVTGFGLYLEGINHPTAFIKAAQRAKQAGKPIVALKAGRTDAGAATVQTHTASLAGADQVVNALFRRLGVIRVETPESLIECLKLVTIQGLLPGNNLITLSCSGGEAAIMADVSERFDVRLGEIPTEHHAAIRAPLNDYVHITNPFDYHTFIWHDPKRLFACYHAVLSSGFDIAILIIDMPRTDRCSDQAWRMPLSGFIRAANATGARTAVAASLGESMPEHIASELASNNIVPFCGLDRAVEAVSLAQNRHCPPVTLNFPKHAQHRVQLDEWRSKKLLHAIGIDVPAGHLCSTNEQAIAAAKQLSYPLVAKALGPDLAHKTEHQAVILNIHDADHLARACGRLLQIGDAILLEQMIDHVVCELLIGIATDPMIGCHIVLASGGVMTEIIDDAQILLLPLDDDEISAALNKLQAGSLLRGFRGRQPGDIGAVVDILHRLERAIVDQKHGIVEGDINPLLVLPEGLGVVAVDALITINGENIQ